jgi:short-subunit dehydrogenase
MATSCVTGGTSGIGLAFARAFAARGDDLILVARDPDRLRVVSDELVAAHGVRVECLAADLSDRADAARVAERLSDAEHPVDTLVNNAGFSVGATLLDASMAKHDVAAEVMMRSVLLLQGAAARAMIARGGGTIVNVASIAGFVTQGHYSAIKAYVVTLTESLAVELRGTGVRVCALCPGYVRTEFHARAGIPGSSVPGPLWLGADALVAACLRDVEAGRVISVPSARWRAIHVALRHAPRPIVRRLSGLLSSARRHEH